MVFESQGGPIRLYWEVGETHLAHLLSDYVKRMKCSYRGYILFQLNEHELGKEIVYYQHSTYKIQEKVVLTWR